MYGIIDYESRWVIGSLHQHRLADDYFVTDKPQVCYSVSKYDNYVSKNNFGASAVKSIVRIISEEQHNLITAECEKIMKAKSLLTTTIGALVGSLPKPKPKIDEEITDVEFEND